MPDERPTQRPAPRQRVPVSLQLAGAAVGLLVLFAAIGLGTSSTSATGTQAHRGLIRAEATAVTIALGWLVVMGLLVAIWALTAKGGPPVQRPAQNGLARHRALILMMAVVAVAFVLYDLLDHTSHGHGQAAPPPARRPVPQQPPRPGSGVVDAHTVAVGLILAVLLTLLALAAWDRWQRHRKGTPTRYGGRADALAEAIDEAIGDALADLDSDLDPRRAVIAAYARMEQALQSNGVPRLPWEAPTEYLDRVLRELGGRAGAVDRLTELYQVAKFSTHEVDEGMRSQAVDALQELRAELAVPA